MVCQIGFCAYIHHRKGRQGKWRINQLIEKWHRKNTITYEFCKEMENGFNDQDSIGRLWGYVTCFQSSLGV